MIKRIGIFCGSSFGASDCYKNEARLLAECIAGKDMEIVYGGADAGLMGVIADSALAAGGRVIGVIPEYIDKRVGHKGLTSKFVVDSMHERKHKMYELSDAFIALPGGFGTFEEIFEIITWAQLGMHKKPFALFNINGYFDGLNAFLENSVKEGFINSIHKEMVIIEDKRDNLLTRIGEARLPENDKFEFLR